MVHWQNDIYGDISIFKPRNNSLLLEFSLLQSGSIKDELFTILSEKRNSIVIYISVKNLRNSKINTQLLSMYKTYSWHRSFARFNTSTPWNQGRNKNGPTDKNHILWNLKKYTYFWQRSSFENVCVWSILYFQV